MALKLMILRGSLMGNDKKNHHNKNIYGVQPKLWVTNPGEFAEELQSYSISSWRWEPQFSVKSIEYGRFI